MKYVTLRNFLNLFLILFIAGIVGSLIYLYTKEPDLCINPIIQHVVTQEKLTLVENCTLEKYPTSNNSYVHIIKVAHGEPELAPVGWVKDSWSGIVDEDNNILFKSVGGRTKPTVEPNFAELFSIDEIPRTCLEGRITFKESLGDKPDEISISMQETLVDEEKWEYVFNPSVYRWKYVFDNWTMEKHPNSDNQTECTISGTLTMDLNGTNIEVSVESIEQN